MTGVVSGAKWHTWAFYVHEIRVRGLHETLELVLLAFMFSRGVQEIDSESLNKIPWGFRASRTEIQSIPFWRAFGVFVVTVIEYAGWKLDDMPGRDLRFERRLNKVSELPAPCRVNCLIHSYIIILVPVLNSNIYQRLNVSDKGMWWYSR
jgi:hypothetical protein